MFAVDDNAIINGGRYYPKASNSLIDNYIYMYHTDTFLVLPGYADSVTDSLSVTYSSSTPLSRSAPIYSYQNSGPRSLQIQFNLHRDMMTQLNTGKSNAQLEGLSNAVMKSPEGYTQDYVDYLVAALQAMALPEYSTTQKMVNPPIVALRLGKDIFIKGVISGAVNVTYKYPILENGKYAAIDISFSINEIEPYDATTVMKQGSYRGLTTTLERRIYNVTAKETAYV